MSRLLIYLNKFDKILIKPKSNLRIAPIRNFSITSTCLNKLVATFEDVNKTVKNSKNTTLLIDVREPQELKETGIIPNSINIPLGDVENVLKAMPNDEFYKKYGRDKPTIDTPIIFSCMIGKRSGQAQEIANKLGYKNAMNYLGSWREWAEKTKSK